MPSWPTDAEQLCFFELPDSLRHLLSRHLPRLQARPESATEQGGDVAAALHEARSHALEQQQRQSIAAQHDLSATVTAAITTRIGQWDPPIVSFRVGVGHEARDDLWHRCVGERDCLLQLRLTGDNDVRVTSRLKPLAPSPPYHLLVLWWL